MNRIVRFYEMLRFVIDCRKVLSLYMIMMLLFTSGCAAVQSASQVTFLQPSLLQNADKISVVMVTASEVATELVANGIRVMQKEGHGYLISWNTDNGQDFVLVLKNTFMPRGLLAGANRVEGILQAFKNDGWVAVSSIELSTLVSKLLTIPMRTIMLMPISPYNSLDTFMNQTIPD
jgi:hypothetical protein